MTIKDEIKCHSCIWFEHGYCNKLHTTVGKVIYCQQYMKGKR